MLPEALAIRAAHPAFCCWHIALSDGNLDDDDVEFCIAEAQRNGHPHCVAISAMMRLASRTQRRKLWAHI
jgi:hypothetical protein